MGCGTKIDLRDDPATIAKLEANGEKPISYKVGQKKAKEIKAQGYLECSAKDFNSVANVSRACTRVIMDKDKKMWADVHKKQRRKIRLRQRNLLKSKQEGEKWTKKPLKRSLLMIFCLMKIEHNDTLKGAELLYRIKPLNQTILNKYKLC